MYAASNPAAASSVVIPARPEGIVRRRSCGSPTSPAAAHTRPSSRLAAPQLTRAPVVAKGASARSPTRSRPTRTIKAIGSSGSPPSAAAKSMTALRRSRSAWQVLARHEAGARSHRPAARRLDSHALRRQVAYAVLPGAARHQAHTSSPRRSPTVAGVAGCGRRAGCSSPGSRGARSRRGCGGTRGLRRLARDVCRDSRRGLLCPNHLAVKLAAVRQR